MKKIKILFLSSSLENSGPVNVLFNIIKYLDREKMDVTILSLGGTVIISYWIGLNGDERIWIKKQMINHICKLGIKNKRNEKTPGIQFCLGVF